MNRRFGYAGNQKSGGTADVPDSRTLHVEDQKSPSE